MKKGLVIGGIAASTMTGAAGYWIGKKHRETKNDVHAENNRILILV